MIIMKSKIDLVWTSSGHIRGILRFFQFGVIVGKTHVQFDLLRGTDSTVEASATTDPNPIQFHAPFGPLLHSSFDAGNFHWEQQLTTNIGNEARLSFKKASRPILVRGLRQDLRKIFLPLIVKVSVAQLVE